ncbi:hypothetical protein K4L04_07535 [Phaeobacter inhibens]|uniref:hypothetical protein n=1 Tax=Phaeobacter inhibens TaxID=221822 RepID=UPI0021A73131|nr:hypothetical protein [Phaeobacter inhibens]UWR77790.1 hypothetical protein K4L04_07535 [Phaeobacter inhibens]
MTMKYLATAATAAVLSLTPALAPVTASAAPPKWAPGHKNSAAHYAPGQIKKQYKKRHKTQERISGDYIYIDDHARWGLAPPAPGHRYIRKDDRIYEVVRDTLAIVGAVALVDALID